MHFGPAAAAPPLHVVSPARSPAVKQQRRPSPLNPLFNIQSISLQQSHSYSYSSNLTHLSNLDRVLRKPAVVDPVENNSSTTTTSSSSTTTTWGFQSVLDLSGVLPAARKAEEMSPRTLNNLHHLLSGTDPKPSPRSTISQRWRDLHGSNDWSGLLDPLDQDLRRELVRYGEYVQAAYQAFFYGDDHHQVVLPDKSYRVTSHLHATSSIQMPKWVDVKAPWLSQRSNWIGYVAVCENQREIQRLGRRDIVIALRGTATCLEWAENFRTGLVNIPDTAAVKELTAAAADPAPPKVECGFFSLFKTRSPGGRGNSLCKAVVEEVHRLMKAYPGEQLSITVTGHSLGAALALLVADELSTCAPEMPPIAVFSFGGPRVGNRGFADRVRRRGVKVLRVVNEQDMVTRVPGVFVNEAAMPWGYSDVGSELRLDSRHSPYLKPDADPSCCHDLEAYLHLVDGFVSLHCPFRSNAKRSIVRLVSQQGSNLKKLYISKAAAIGVRLDALDTSPVTVASGSVASPNSASPATLGR